MQNAVIYVKKTDRPRKISDQTVLENTNFHYLKSEVAIKNISEISEMISDKSEDRNYLYWSCTILLIAYRLLNCFYYYGGVSIQNCK
jgi:hypothetical protein